MLRNECSEACHCVVTTFSNDGFILYGKKFVESFQRMNPKLDLILVLDDSIDYLESSSCDHLIVLQNRYHEHIKGFLAAYNQRAERPQSFEFRADRFVYKPAAIMTAIEYLNESNQMRDPAFLTWVDGDTVFLRPGFDSLLTDVAPNPLQIASVLDRKSDFYFLEAGLIIFNRKLEATRIYVGDVLDTFFSERVFDLHEWHDGLIWTLEMYKRPPGFFRLLCSENTWRGEHPIAENEELSRFLDHVKGTSRKSLGFSPERFGFFGKNALKIAVRVKRFFQHNW